MTPTRIPANLQKSIHLVYRGSGASRPAEADNSPLISVPVDARMHRANLRAELGLATGWPQWITGDTKERLMAEAVTDLPTCPFPEIGPVQEPVDQKGIVSIAVRPLPMMGDIWCLIDIENDYDILSTWPTRRMALCQAWEEAEIENDSATVHVWFELFLPLPTGYRLQSADNDEPGGEAGWYWITDDHGLPPAEIHSSRLAAIEAAWLDHNTAA